MAPFEKITLNTKRLLIRPLVKSDAESLFSIYADPDVMRYWNTPPWSNLSCAEAFIMKAVEALHAGSRLCLGIEIISDRQIIGTCSLFSFDEQCKRAEIGYILARRFWGQGFMKEALIVLIDYAFNHLSLHRLEADIDPRNTSSANILNSLGFRKEGHLRERWIINEEVLDSDIYGLLRYEWSQGNAVNNG